MRLRFLSSSVVLVLVLAFTAPAVTRSVHAAAGPYAPAGEIAIGGAGSFDYLNVDRVNNRLYVSHGTEVVIIDTVKNTVVGRLADTPGVHGIAIAPELSRAFTTNGRENMVGIFDIKTQALIGKVDSGGANPDALVYDPAHKQVWAFNHTGNSATAIDAVTGKALATVPLSGTAETGVVDAALNRIFVNIEDKDAIDVIDGATHKVVATWPVAPGASPTGLAIDPAAHRLFVGAGPMMVMMDDTNGKVVASVPLCGGTDATWFDPGTKLAMSSCSDGHITVARVDSPSAMTVVQTLDTARGARTMALDLLTHKIYTAAQKYPAAGPGAIPAAIPDSFHVLVYAMAQ